MWAFFLLTSFALAVQAVALFSVGEEQEDDLINGVLNATLDGVIAQHVRSTNVVLGQRITLYHAPAGQVPAGMPESIAKLPIGNHEWFIGKQEFHVGVRDDGGERYYLLYDETEHEERLTSLKWTLILGAVLLSLFSLGLGLWLSRALLRQLEILAKKLDTEDPGRLVLPEQDREIALLAQALEDYRARNAALIAREREFTANVSHELRTQLTRIRTSAELLVDGGSAGARAQKIIHSVDDLERRLAGLLFLARGQLQPERQDVRLQALVDNLLEPYRDICDSRGVALENQISPQETLEANPALLSLLLDNLLRNAVNHTVSGRIVFGYAGGCLSLRDTGEGIPADKLSQVFERHFRVEGLRDGGGLGLAIAREIVERCGWQCELQSNLGEGTEVRVRLKP